MDHPVKDTASKPEIIKGEPGVFTGAFVATEIRNAVHSYFAPVRAVLSDMKDIKKAG